MKINVNTLMNLENMLHEEIQSQKAAYFLFLII